MAMIVVILLNMIVLPLYTFIKLIKVRRFSASDYKIARKMKRARCIARAASFMTVIISVYLLYKILFPVESTIVGTDEREELQMTYVDKYDIDDIYSQIEFKGVLLSNENTFYQFMVNECLHFTYFDEWNEDLTSKKELRNKYLTEIGEESNLPIASLEDIRKMAKSFYGTSLLPETDKTLIQIENLTPELSERINADPDLFKAEFWLRIKACEGDEVSSECLYQAARAADDVVKTLGAQGKLSTRELLFYSSASVALYEQAITKKDDLNRYWISAVKYRIGEMYFYLYKHLKYNADSVIERDKFSEHLLLCAEATLLSGYDDFVAVHKAEDIHKTQPYHDSYVAIAEYDLIRKYGYANQEIIDECFMRAQNYIASHYARSGDITSCEDIIQKLVAQGYIDM